MGLATSPHRQKRERHYLEQSRQRKGAALLRGFSEGAAQDAGRWHDARAKGQRERIDRVLSCGAEVLEILCPSCGRKHERSAGCRVGLLCLRCRGEIAQRKRAQFLAARTVVLDRARERGLLNPYRPRGRFSEKFLTLTAPHVPGDTVAVRVARIRAAWTGFLRRLNAHWRSRREKSAQFFRCLEWTPGDDGAGHPHIHVWLFCTFLDRGQVSAWWRDALLEAGLPPTFDTIVTHVCAMRDGEGGARELIKYLTKDIDPTGEAIDPKVFAAVYEAFDGGRSTQASRGFMALGRTQRQCECGSPLPRRVNRKAKDSPPGSTPSGGSSS